MKTSAISAFVAPAIAAALAVFAVGCGSESPTGPSAQGPPPTLIGPAGSEVVPAAGADGPGTVRRDVVMPRNGLATVTLRWPNADFSLQLYVTSGVCADTATLVTGGCNVLGRTRPGDLPGVVTSPVASGAEHTVWVLNPDPYPQSFTIDVGIE
jgi:hypothetical protein